MNQLIQMEEPDNRRQEQDEQEQWLYFMERDKLRNLDTHLTRNLHELEHNMRIGEMKESKYLKKEDAGTGKLVTIRKLSQTNVAMEGKEPDMKWIIHFDEFDKGAVLNWTNIQLIAKAVGSEETNDWIGKKVVMYEDPNVSFGGELVGGIRFRAPRQTPVAAQAAPAPAVTQALDDDIPF